MPGSEVVAIRSDVDAPRSEVAAFGGEVDTPGGEVDAPRSEVGAPGSEVDTAGIEVETSDECGDRYVRTDQRRDAIVAEQSPGYQAELPWSSADATSTEDRSISAHPSDVGDTSSDHPAVAPPLANESGAATLPVSPQPTTTDTSAATKDCLPADTHRASNDGCPTDTHRATDNGWTSEDGETASRAAFGSAVDCVVARLRDPGDLEGWASAEVRERLALLRRLEGATTAGIAAAVAALDRAGGVRSDGAPSKAEWLKTHTGRTGREAARMARLADNIGDLPGTAAALADGTLGPDAADTIVKATRDPRLGPPAATEADLLKVAGTSTPEQLRREVRRRQQAVDGDSLLRDERRQHALRNVTLVRDNDAGMWDLHGRVSDECGTRLRTVLDAFDHGDPSGTPLLERRRPGQRLADALDQLAATALDHSFAPARAGIARPHLTVIVDLPTVARDLTRDDEPDPDAPDAAMTPDHPGWADLPAGETMWGGMLSPQSVRRFLCDAAVSRVVMAGGSQVLDVGRATREWSEPQRRAVNARDRGCRGPSCSYPIAWTQVHHVRWWSSQGDTAVANGIALCHHCHRLVHDVGWILEFDPETATATWTSPDGRTVRTTPHHAPESPDLATSEPASQPASQTPSQPPFQSATQSASQSASQRQRLRI